MAGDSALPGCERRHSSPGGRRRYGPELGQDTRARSSRRHPVQHERDIVDVTTLDREALETDPAELVLAIDVATTTDDAEMVRSVVLADDAPARIHQVGVPDQPAAGVEHGRVAERSIPPGVQHPDEPEPALHG